MNNSINNLWHFVIGSLLILAPSIVLLHKSAPGILLHFLAGIGLIKLIIYACSEKNSNIVKAFWYKYKYICIAMPSVLIVNIVMHALYGNITDAFSNPAQRLALTGLVLLSLYKTPKQLHKHINTGFIFACFVALTILFHASYGGQARPDVDTQNLLNYANYIVLLGMFSLIAIQNINAPYKNVKNIISILAFTSVIYAIVLSQSKGPLLSLLILFVLYTFNQLKNTNNNLKFIIITSIIVLISVAALSNNQFNQRILSTIAATDSSTKIRLGLWKASILMFKENPIIGNGKSFATKLEDLNNKNLIDDHITWKADKKEMFRQAHNEGFHTIATNGLIGVFALFCIYLVPFYYFFTRKKYSAYLESNKYAQMGIVTCLGFIAFGFTVTAFTSNWMTANYVLLISSFIAFSE